MRLSERGDRVGQVAVCADAGSRVCTGRGGHCGGAAGRGRAHDGVGAAGERVPGVSEGGQPVCLQGPGRQAGPYRSPRCHAPHHGRCAARSRRTPSQHVGMLLCISPQELCCFPKIVPLFSTNCRHTCVQAAGACLLPEPKHTASCV